MNKLIFMTVVTVVLANAAGCNTCRRMTGGWFNRGDRCAPPPVDCAPGLPQATMMMPSGPQVLPGPIEIGPVN